MTIHYVIPKILDICNVNMPVPLDNYKINFQKKEERKKW
jgi:hypothetical protein